MNKALTLAAAILLGAPLAAQSHFQDQPGFLELTGRMTVRPLQNVETSAETRSRLDGLVLKHFSKVDEYLISLPTGMTEDAVFEWLMATGDYEYVHPDWMCYPLNTPNDSNFGQQWHHQNMESELGWDTITDASNIIAAFTDTGVDTNHPDLVNNLIPGYNQVSGVWQNLGGDIEDINGHGTWVGGCIGAEGNNGIGVAGMAWNIQLMPIRVSEDPSGGAYLSDLTDGARVAVDNGASTISASYSGVENGSIGTTGTYIKGQGGLYFYAAGNSNANHSSFDYPDVIVVGATTSSDAKASFSSFGLAVDCVAPGVGIESTARGGGYSDPSGTSFSTPLTNGVAAMIFAQNPGLSAQGVEDILLSTCDDLGAAGEDNTFGHGLVNLRAAVEAGVASPLVLTMGNMVAGASVNIRVDDCTAFASVLLAYTFRGLGSSFEPSTGETLGINNHRIGLTLSADGFGIVDTNRVLPSGLSGRTIWVQMTETGNVSNIHNETIS
ncbi:MAG: S8 family serine peptidase [Planctomycetota bacterium]|nr:S8 family serine peptidase [Planctomycetota bacterium]MDA1113467.1 S8 family serine peptidase [Planctomycetota bacterium]